jgi:isopenicillin-N N-acyltransferase-like protein
MPFAEAVMLELIRLKGTPYEMGRQHGEQLAVKIRELSGIRFNLATTFAGDHGVDVSREDCVKLARVHLPLHEEHCPEVVEEWRGIADGAGIPIEDVFFANALTDFQDVLWQCDGVEVHGCTSFLIGPEASANGHALIGQTWDMHASAERFIAVFHRVPNEGPESITLTTAGCLTLIGVNSFGIAVGNNNLRPMDARPGVIYLALLHLALRQTDWRAAISVMTDLPRASGHNYIMAHESGARSNIETTGTLHEELALDAPRYVHSNHYLSEKLQPLEEPGMLRGSTEHRLKRLATRMEDHPELLTPESLRSLLADHEGGEELGICRHGEGEDARSCAFAVVDPAARVLHAALGPACEATLSEFRIER